MLQFSAPDNIFDGLLSKWLQLARGSIRLRCGRNFTLRFIAPGDDDKAVKNVRNPDARIWHFIDIDFCFLPSHVPALRSSGFCVADNCEMNRMFGSLIADRQKLRPVGSAANCLLSWKSFIWSSQRITYRYFEYYWSMEISIAEVEPDLDVGFTLSKIICFFHGTRTLLGKNYVKTENVKT